MAYIRIGGGGDRIYHTSSTGTKNITPQISHNWKPHSASWYHRDSRHLFNLGEYWIAPDVLALSLTLAYSGGREAWICEEFKEIFCSFSPRQAVEKANSGLTQTHFYSCSNFIPQRDSKWVCHKQKLEINSDNDSMCCDGFSTLHMSHKGLKTLLIYFLTPRRS